MNIVSETQFLQALKILLSTRQVLDYKPNMPNAVVFDIDGTLVYDHSWDKPIKSVIKFCNHCREIGVSPIIVTARPGWQENIEKTKESLQGLGIQCDALFFRKPDIEDLGSYKTNVREYITKNAKYNILISIGDNPWDYGKYGGTGVLMAAAPSSNVIKYQIISN